MQCGRVTRVLAGTALVVLQLLISVIPAGARQDTPATPGGVANTPGSLVAMLGQLPAMPLFDEEEGEMAIVSYFNQDAQLAAVGAEPATSLDDPGYQQWFQAVRGMPYVIRTADSLYMPEAEEQFGFTVFQVDQSVTYYLWDTQVSLLRGRFDQAKVEATLQKSGYQPVTEGGVTYLSLAADGELNWDSPVGMTAMGTMTNAAFLDDGTLVFTSSRERMRVVFEVAAGRAPSFASQEDIAPLLGTVDPDIAAAWITSGLAFGVSDPMADMARLEAASDVAGVASDVAQLPPVRTVLLGVTAGGPLPALGARESTPEPLAPGMPASRLQIGLVMLDHASAEAAAPVLEDRLVTLRTNPAQLTFDYQTDKPYTELFPEHEVRVGRSEPVVLIDLGLGDGVGREVLFRLWDQRNLAIIAW